MGDHNTCTNLCNFRSAINAFRRDLYQGCLNHKNSLNTIEDRLWDIWPEGRDVDLVRAKKIQEVRNSIDAVYDDARAVRGVMRDGKKISDFLEYSNDTEAQKRLQEEGTKKHGPFPPDPTLLSKSN